jgi:hypothetical protein
MLGAQALRVCFLLHNHKNPVVRNTAAATLRQVSVMLLEKAASYLAHRQSAREPEPPTSTATSTATADTVATAPTESATDDSKPPAPASNPESDGTAAPIATTTTAAVAAAASANTPPTISLGEWSVRDAATLIEDLCSVSGGDAANWLARDLVISPAFGLDLIESLLVSHTDLFRNTEPFR